MVHSRACSTLTSGHPKDYTKKLFILLLAHEWCGLLHYKITRQEKKIVWSADSGLRRWSENWASCFLTRDHGLHYIQLYSYLFMNFLVFNLKVKWCDYYGAQLITSAPKSCCRFVYLHYSMCCGVRTGTTVAQNYSLSCSHTTFWWTIFVWPVAAISVHFHTNACAYGIRHRSGWSFFDLHKQ